jgi:hypothetical protein
MLQEDEILTAQRGIIDRRAGSGSYVTADAAPSYTIVLPIPELDQTEIFEPIC